MRLDNRFLELRTPANQAIFKIQSGVCQLFKECLWDKGFQEIHSPKLIAGASEGGAAVFKLDYKVPSVYGRVCERADGCIIGMSHLSPSC